MRIPPFPATVEKCGRIYIPKKFQEQFKIGHNKFFMVLLMDYEDFLGDFFTDAFKEAIKPEMIV